jgi:hypothetical protein
MPIEKSPPAAWASGSTPHSTAPAQPITRAVLPHIDPGAGSPVEYKRYTTRSALASGSRPPASSVQRTAAKQRQNKPEITGAMPKTGGSSAAAQFGLHAGPKLKSPEHRLMILLLEQDRVAGLQPIRDFLCHLENWVLRWSDLADGSTRPPQLEAWVNAAIDRLGLDSKTLDALNHAYSLELQADPGLVPGELMDQAHKDFLTKRPRHISLIKKFLLHLERWGTSLPDLLDGTKKPPRLSAWLNAAVDVCEFPKLLQYRINTACKLNLKSSSETKRFALFDPAHMELITTQTAQGRDRDAVIQIGYFFAYLESNGVCFQQLLDDKILLKTWVDAATSGGTRQELRIKTAINAAYGPQSRSTGIVEQELPRPHRVEQPLYAAHALPDVSSGATRTQAGSAQGTVVELEEWSDVLNRSWKANELFSVRHGGVPVAYRVCYDRQAGKPFDLDDFVPRKWDIAFLESLAETWPNLQ